MHLCLLCSWKAAVGRVGCLTVSEINAINSICLFALGRRGACCAPNACWSYYVSQKPKQCQLIARSLVPNKLHFCTKSVGVSAILQKEKRLKAAMKEIVCFVFVHLWTEFELLLSGHVGSA